MYGQRTSVSMQQPRKRWLGNAENDTKKMGVRGWRKIARYRDAWKMDPEGGRGPDRTLESEKRNVQPYIHVRPVGRKFS